jgi:hypothetical protein
MLAARMAYAVRMSDDPEAKSEERRARLELGYRQNIGPVVHQIEREELLARLEELGKKIEAIQAKLDAKRDPTWKIALRVVAALAVWGGLVALGGWLGGLWGGLAALAAPVVLPVLWVTVSHFGGKLLRRRAPRRE